MGTSNPFDFIKTTQWSLRCMDHKKQGLVFELKNIQTERAHKMIFSGAGTNSITTASLWTSGVYAANFTTKYPVNFENFNNNLASLKPFENDKKNAHLFLIGWLAVVKLNQPFGDGIGMWNFFGNCRIEYGTGESITAKKSAAATPSGSAYLQYELADTMVTSYSFSGSGG